MTDAPVADESSRRSQDRRRCVPSFLVPHPESPLRNGRSGRCSRITAEGTGSPSFGLGDAQGKVDRNAALGTLVLVLLVVVVEGTAAAPPTGSPKPQR